MRDCMNAEMKDLLPDLLQGSGAAELHARVRAHLESCAECRDELELLRRLRGAAVTPRIDTASIVAALPRYPARWRRAARSPLLRIAAAVVLVAGGVTVLTDAPRDGGRDSAVVRVATGASAELSVGDQLSDLSEGDLRALLDELGEMEAVTPVEPDVIVMPAVERRGGV